ncbi:hypothetical protein PAXRUDRAFT_91257, partial [Paxillus rubicundulus Ve08.2h10]
WLRKITSVQQLLTDILQVVHPSLHDICSQTLSTMQSNPNLQDSTTGWPTVFEVMELIVNHAMPWHRDSGGCPEAYDCLLNLGNCQEARFDIADCGASLSYMPGSVIYLTGRVLMHSI